MSFTLTQRKKKEDHLVNTCSVITLHEILYEIFHDVVRQQFDSNKKSYCDLTNSLDKKFVFKAKVYLHSQSPHLVVVSKTFFPFKKRLFIKDVSANGSR